MSHVPGHATTYLIDVPDEEAAGQVARVLVERGHSVVRVTPWTAGRGPVGGFTGSGWRVTGQDEGPYPTDDASWWMAAEDRAVAALAAAFLRSSQTYGPKRATTGRSSSSLQKVAGPSGSAESTITQLMSMATNLGLPTKLSDQPRGRARRAVDSTLSKIIFHRGRGGRSGVLALSFGLA